MENLRGILIKTENWTAHLTFLARDLIETLSITTHDGYAYVRRLTVHSCFAYSTFFHEHFNSRIVSILSIDRLQRTFDSRCTSTLRWLLREIKIQIFLLTDIASNNYLNMRSNNYFHVITFSNSVIDIDKRIPQPSKFRYIFYFYY